MHLKKKSLKCCLFSKKIVYESSESNKIPILEVLQKYFDKYLDGQVLEIASGTGQHISYFAAHFPRLTFQPSENDTSLFDSIKAYAEETPTKNVKDPIRINITDDWATWNVPNDFDYVININMIHVTPFSCTLALFKNVCGVLKIKGLLITYGPYANNGVLEPKSNKDFDRSIRARDPECGVRDIQDLVRVAEPHGMKIVKIHDMPANNKCLVWKKFEKFNF